MNSFRTLWRATAVVLGLLVTIGFGPLPAAQAQDDVSVAAFNLENFFDIYDNPYTDDADPKVPFEVGQLAAALTALDADIVGICEVENEAIVRAMLHNHAPQLGYRYLTVQPTNSGRGINLGVLSRHPIYSLTSYRFNDFTLPGENRSWRFARDLLHVQIDINDTMLHLFVVHFKSKRTTDDSDPQSTTWRRAEATFARGVINDILADDPQARIAIVGDFNDTLDSTPMRALLDGGQLLDTHADLPADAVTYLNEPYRARIDFVLASPALDALRTEAVIASDEAILGGSDHAPVMTTFAWPAAD